jgi:hypothetical protein
VAGGYRLPVQGEGHSGSLVTTIPLVMVTHDRLP